MHPEILVSAIPMGLSMAAWESGDHDTVASELRRGVEQVAAAGADFYLCPDNTAHIVLEPIAGTLPIPGLHIADVVAQEMHAAGWRVAGLLGTTWTMTGSVYAKALQRRGLRQVVPHDERREQINRAIFEELCQGLFLPATRDMFIAAIRELAAVGADCAILGCTEIPLIINEENSPLPVLDSTRLVATYAVRVALCGQPLQHTGGWVIVDQAVPGAPKNPELQHTRRAPR
jgi:aspartate racemase